MAEALEAGLPAIQELTLQTNPRSPGPIILDYSFSGIPSPEFEEALINQPAKVFSSVETILGTNLGLTTIPTTLGIYLSLKHLDLSFNHLSVVPESLSQCTQLITLALKNNSLDDIGFPKDWSALTQLRELNLSGNHLTRVPEPIFHLSSSLVTLHLGGNRLGALPKEIAQLSKLQVRIYCCTTV